MGGYPELYRVEENTNTWLCPLWLSPKINAKSTRDCEPKLGEPEWDYVSETQQEPISSSDISQKTPNLPWNLFRRHRLDHHHTLFNIDPPSTDDISRH